MFRDSNPGTAGCEEKPAFFRAQLLNQDNICYKKPLSWFSGGNMCMAVGLGLTSAIIRGFEIVDLRGQPQSACTSPPDFPIDAPRAISLVEPSGRLCVCGGRQSTTMYNNQCYCQQSGSWVNDLNMLEKRYFAGISKVTFSNGTQVNMNIFIYFEQNIRTK